ncbi:protein kinase [Pendulispora brunnea]|uniref:Protein kinase n=1 Tax=Pendulispora brunnea TaxID=2905690 RepID=A0ABZ2KJN9_9BACT
MRSSEYTVRVRALGAAQLFADRFAIEHEAGVGNMGVVYRATDRITSARVALKVLHPHRAPEIGRFVSELSVLAAIRHPAIIAYLSHGITIDDERFLVTEWVDGETLAARLAREPLSVVSALALGHRIADGLAALHAAGVVHGDLKPSNVFLPRTTDGTGARLAKLIDFGLPHPFARAGSSERGLELDIGADLVSLGTVILQSLTTEAPLTPRTREPRWLRAFCPDAPLELEELLDALLTKNDADRPGTAAEMRETLAQILATVSKNGDHESELGVSLPKTLSSAPSMLPRNLRTRFHGDAFTDVDEKGPPVAPSPAMAEEGRSREEVRRPEEASPEMTVPSRPAYDSDRGLHSGMTFAGRYLLEARVGVGGMGELFRAFDTRLRRTVALKVLHRDRALHAPTESSARILREARAAAALSHANVVAIHDVGEHEGVPFIAMEYVEGQSLRAFVGSTYPPFETRLGWMIDVARALAAAHEKGLVHRDIKPDNVMIREDGTVKVLDFGIARYKEGLPDIQSRPLDGTELESGDLSVAATNTRVVGTPGYMAPEQTRGDRIDGRADQFSWGVVAFEVVSGSLPWPLKRGGLSIAAAALSEQAKPLGSAVPARVAQVIHRTLSKAAGDRYPSMRDVVSALGASPDISVNIPAARISVAKLVIASSDSSRDISPLLPDTKTDTSEDGDEVAPESRSWLSGRRSTILVAVLFTLMIATVFGGRAVWRSKDPAAAASSRALAHTPATEGTAIVALPASPKCTAAATAHYRDGLSALREANWELAYTAFTQAVQADPSCPEAQLRRVMTGTWYEPIVKQREQFRRAAELRDALSERDRVLFDSLLPLVILDPPDREVSGRVVDAGLTRFPRDAELLLWAATVRMNLPLDVPALERALELATRATDIDPKYADGWQFQGRVLARLGRLDDELSALDACLRTSPGASDCMHDRVLIQRWRGHCSEIASEARRWIARSPTSSSAYWQLALALAEEGAPDETIEEAVRQQLAHQPEEHQEARWLHAMARLAVYRGDFAKAERLATQLAKLTTTDPALPWHVRPASLLVSTAEETGHLAKASAIAEPFMRLHAVWTVGDPTPELMSYEPQMLAVLLRNGRLSSDEWRTRTHLWQERVGTRLGKLDSWGFIWGPVADVRELAVEGWSQAPNMTERMPTFIGFNTFDLRTAEIQRGRLALAVGEYARAVEILDPASKSCLSFEQPFVNTHAHLWLGEAKERTGDKAGACEAYRFVLQRWGAAKPASKSAEEARKRARALACAIP